MVILQFNKIIRNKWIWGAFAVAISAFFAFDFLLDDLRSPTQENSVGMAGRLAGEEVNAELFRSIQEEIRGLGRQRDYKTEQSEVNLRAWENYAALVTAGKNGVEATDDEVMAAIRRDPTFQQNGAFSFKFYELLLRENGLKPERYEASLKRQLTLMRIRNLVMSSATWASPLELDQMVKDMTDVLTVKVATFTQEKKTMKVSDAELKTWYDEHVTSLELPARTKIRYVKFDATATNILAKMTLTEDDLRDRYDATIDKYTSTDTNGVETVKKFEEVKDGIEKEVRQIAAVQYFETNLNFRAYGIKASTKDASRLDEIAKEDGLKVQTSDWFSTENVYQEGFMKRPYQILPGAENFLEAVAELDPENEDLRYAVVSGKRAVWLVEVAEKSAKHIPTFEEAKKAIEPRASKDAAAAAFKAEIEALAAKGAKAVLASKNVSTNLTFAVADLKPGDFPDQNAVARAASKLKKGEISEFTLAGMGRALLVVCEDRADGDAGKAMILRSQARETAAMVAAGEIPTAWLKWNLERLGFETGDISSVEKVEVED